MGGKRGDSRTPGAPLDDRLQNGGDKGSRPRPRTSAHPRGQQSPRTWPHMAKQGSTHLTIVKHLHVQSLNGLHVDALHHFDCDGRQVTSRPDAQQCISTHREYVDLRRRRACRVRVPLVMP